MSNSKEIVDGIVNKYHDTLKDKVVFASFYLQELDGASRGGPASRAWAKSKPFDPGWYSGALDTDDENADNVQMGIILMMKKDNKNLSNLERSQLKMSVMDELYKRYVTDVDK